ncbi:MAG: hypothetical protein CL677_06500 [Bdellovibrionaceae bacterium]|nr:hypothetical protein [Pseudobdellovibrionaceae bacterium]|tara:strand:- start:10036 stop:10416 length:381 start_codon:yes stop_codon:yes gene_type:complete
MKLIAITLSILISSIVALADTPPADEQTPIETPVLEIRRFVYINSNELRSPTAEMCGRVSEIHGADRIIVTTDKGRRAESRYTTMTDDQGVWCVVVKTLTGQGEARVWRMGAGTFGTATAEASTEE